MAFFLTTGNISPTPAWIMIQHNKLVSTPLHKEYFGPTVWQSLAHKQPYNFLN